MTIRLVLACVLLTLSWHTAAAEDVGVTARDAWIREAPPGAQALAGYLVIENHSDRVRTLVGVSSGDFGRLMVHRSQVKNGMTHMVHLDKVDIGAHATLDFAPGGYHIMLMHPRKPVKVGDKVRLDLAFKDGTRLPVDFEVRTQGPAASHHHH